MTTPTDNQPTNPPAQPETPRTDAEEKRQRDLNDPSISHYSMGWPNLTRELAETTALAAKLRAALEWFIKQRFLIPETDNGKFAECLEAYNLTPPAALFAHQQEVAELRQRAELAEQFCDKQEAIKSLRAEVVELRKERDELKFNQANSELVWANRIAHIQKERDKAKANYAMMCEAHRIEIANCNTAATERDSLRSQLAEKDRRFLETDTVHRSQIKFQHEQLAEKDKEIERLKTMLADATGIKNP